MKYLFLMFFAFSAMPMLASAADLAPSCLSGQIAIPAGGGKIILNIQIKDNQLDATVANPDDVLNAGGTQKTVKEVFNPGPSVKLIPQEGLKCPCEGYKSENGKFTLIVEHLDDGTTRNTVNYFNLYNGLVALNTCSVGAGN